MLEMGFAEDVENVIAVTGTQKQTLLFSATFNDQVRMLAHRFMHQPPHIKVEMKQANRANDKSILLCSKSSDKVIALQQLLKQLNPVFGYYFCKHARSGGVCDRAVTVQVMKRKPYTAECRKISGSSSWTPFRKVKFQYLVCTDIAARGVDVEG